MIVYFVFTLSDYCTYLRWPISNAALLYNYEIMSWILLRSNLPTYLQIVGTCNVCYISYNYSYSTLCHIIIKILKS